MRGMAWACRTQINDMKDEELTRYEEGLGVHANAVFLIAKLKCIPILRDGGTWYYRPNQRWFPLGNSNEEAFTHLVELEKNCVSW